MTVKGEISCERVSRCLERSEDPTVPDLRQVGRYVRPVRVGDSSVTDPRLPQ